jgi:hypothetical protein
MESPDEIGAHQRMEKGKQGNMGYWKVESLDEPQEEIIKGGRGIPFKWSHQER